MPVRLRQVAITDLNYRFARDMGNNKIRHYLISYQAYLANHFVGKSVESMISEYLRDVENETEVEFLPARGPIQLVSRPLLNGSNSTNDIIDASSIVLARDSKVRKALSRIKTTSTLHQTTTAKRRLFDLLADKYNRYIAYPINKLLYTLQGYDNTYYQPYVRQLRLIQIDRKPVINPVRFLAIAFLDEDANEALEQLRSDLRILQSKNLILGHLAMPSIMGLADTVGFGSNAYVLFCFPIINQAVLEKLIQSESADKWSMSLRLVGVKNETLEGGTNWLGNKTREDKYLIEEVDIFQNSKDLNYEKMVENYNNTKDAINDHAKKMKAVIDRFEKLPLNLGSKIRPGDQLEFLDKETGEIFQGLDTLTSKISKSKND